MQIQHIDKVVDVLVQKDVQVPMIRKEQKIVKVPQIQYIDRVVEFAVLKQLLVLVQYSGWKNDQSN